MSEKKKEEVPEPCVKTDPESTKCSHCPRNPKNIKKPMFKRIPKWDA